MGINLQSPEETKQETNSLAVIALALAIIPSLAASLELTVIQSSDDAMFDALIRNGASNFVIDFQIGVIPAIILALLASHYRPGRLSDIAGVVTVANMFFALWLYYITPFSLK